MKALIYGFIALAAISCAAVQPEHSTLLEDSAVRLAHGEPGFVLEQAPSQAEQAAEEQP